MAAHVTTNYPGGTDYSTAFKRISWGAVFAGVVVALMVNLLLALLGLGIGLGAVDPMQEQNPFAGLGIPAALWWGLSMLVALYLGGLVAGRLSGVERPFDAFLHGVLTWGITSLLTFFLLGTAVGRLVGGAVGMVSQGLSAAARGGTEALSGVVQGGAEQIKEVVPLQSIKEEARQLLQTSTSQQGITAQEAQDFQAQLTEALEQAFRNGADKIEPATRADLVKVVAATTGLSQAEAEQTVANWTQNFAAAERKLEQTKERAEDKAREVGQMAAEGVSQASLWASLALLLGGAAAGLGGRTGLARDKRLAVRRTDERRTDTGT